jgi:hypothetical protein
MPDKWNEAPTRFVGRKISEIIPARRGLIQRSSGGKIGADFSAQTPRRQNRGSLFFSFNIKQAGSDR